MTSDLVRKAQRHDLEAFTELFQQHRGLVFSICLSMVVEIDAAEDLTEETFVAAFERLPTLRDPTRFVAWLRRLAGNNCRMWLRRQRETAVEALPDRADQEPTGTVDNRLLLEEALRTLPEQGRLVLTLRFGAGRSYREIADMLDVTEDRVRSRLHEARQQLKRELLKTVRELLQQQLGSEELAQQVLSRCRGVECTCAAELLHR